MTIDYLAEKDAAKYACVSLSQFRRLTQQEVADHVHDLFEYVRRRDEE